MIANEASLLIVWERVWSTSYTVAFVLSFRMSMRALDKMRRPGVTKRFQIPIASLSTLSTGASLLVVNDAPETTLCSFDRLL